MGKGKNKKKFNKPNFLIYSLARLISFIIAKFIFKLKVKRNEIKKKKGPFIVIANHESSIDFINIIAACKNKMVYVISNSFYNSLSIHSLIKAFGAIPKQQFQTSTEDLKKMKTVIKNNYPLVLFPAGLMTENGISNVIVKGTGKFLKWLNVDVYYAKTEGSYLTNPKWGRCGFRKGQITLDIYKLYDKNELNNFTDNELQEDVEKKLAFNSYDNQERNMIEFKKGDNVEGLENLLYVCPKCYSEYKIISKNNKLICPICNNTAIADKYGFLNKEKEDDVVYKKVSDWHKFIFNRTEKEILANKEYTLSEHATIDMINYKKHKFETVGEGIITFNSECFIIDGKINNEKVYKVISNKSFHSLPFSPGRHFEIQEGKEIYRIKLDNPSHISKWMIALRVFYNNRNN